MAILRLTFLGTGTSLGIPMLACNCRVCLSKDRRDRRLRSSVLVEKANTTLLIDAGPDLRWQLLRIGKTKLDALCLTHFHRDHLGGLDELRALIFRKQQPLPVYANEQSLAALHRQYEYADFGGEKLSEKFATLSLNLRSIAGGECVQIGDIQLRAVQVWHGKLAILGFVLDERMVYLTDVKYVDAEVCASLQHKQLLVLNALRQAPHPTHLNLAEALDLIRGLQAEKTYLTHISHSLGLHAEVSRTLPPEVSLAYDMLSISLS